VSYLWPPTGFVKAPLTLRSRMFCPAGIVDAVWSHSFGNILGFRFTSHSSAGQVVNS
jgi:hypothetical protein